MPWKMTPDVASLPVVCRPFGMRTTFSTAVIGVDGLSQLTALQKKPHVGRPIRVGDDLRTLLSLRILAQAWL